MRLVGEDRVTGIEVERTAVDGDGRAVGTATYYGGSGRFAGMTGGSKYDCGLMGDRFICDVRGFIELP